MFRFAFLSFRQLKYVFPQRHFSLGNEQPVLQKEFDPDAVKTMDQIESELREELETTATSYYELQELEKRGSIGDTVALLRLGNTYLQGSDE